MQPEPRQLLHGDLHIPRQELTDHFRTDTLRQRLQDTGLELDWVGVGTWEIRGAGHVRADELIAAWQASRGASPQVGSQQPGHDRTGLDRRGMARSRSIAGGTIAAADRAGL